MHQEIINRLLTLNREFYQSFAEPFSESRGRIQPGVQKAINQVPQDSLILDVGCGHGGLARALDESGHKGTYTGIDSSAELLAFAQEIITHPKAHFLQRDISNPDWYKGLPGPFDRVFCFATLHHIPGEELRKSIFNTFSRLLKPDGLLVFSVWNFLASPRLRARIVPWESVQLEPDELDPQDYLLDWRRGGYGVRYVHAFSREEFERIASETSFEIVETYYSDGKGGKLGSYHVWEPAGEHDL